MGSCVRTTLIWAACSREQCTPARLLRPAEHSDPSAVAVVRRRAQSLSQATPFAVARTLLAAARRPLPRTLRSGYHAPSASADKCLCSGLAGVKRAQHPRQSSLANENKGGPNARLAHDVRPDGHDVHTAGMWRGANSPRPCASQSRTWLARRRGVGRAGEGRGRIQTPILRSCV